jgi:hypothetical protein
VNDVRHQGADQERNHCCPYQTPTRIGLLAAAKSFEEGMPNYATPRNAELCCIAHSGRHDPGSLLRHSNQLLVYKLADSEITEFPSVA